jgi:flagellar hook-associated protein 2
LAGIQLSGLASGLDTEGLISGLLSIERIPRTRLTLQQAAVRAREEGLNQVRDKLSALKTASDALSSVLTWSPIQTAEVNDPTKASVRVTGGAAPGGYTINVTALATAAQSTYNFQVRATDRTVSLNGQSLLIEGNSTIDDVVAKVNADDKYGVYAVKTGLPGSEQLVLASRTTGSASAITLTGGGGQVTLASSRAGTNALYTVNGGAQQSSPKNLLSGTSGATYFVSGTEITLKSTGSFTVNINPPAIDKSQVESKVKAFVDAYNSAMDLMKAKTSEKRVPGAATESDARKGALWADGSVRSVMDSLRFVTSTHKQSGNSVDFDQLAELGISTGDSTGSGTFSQDAVAGKLKLDTAKLTAAIEAKPQDVQRLLGGITGTNGFAQALTGALDPYTRAGGVFASRVEAATSEIKRLDDSLARMDDRLSRKEESLRKMFTALEVALSRSQAQSSAMASQLAGLASNNE